MVNINTAKRARARKKFRARISQRKDVPWTIRFRKSNIHTYGEILDSNSQVAASLSTLSHCVKEQIKAGANCSAAEILGEEVSKICKKYHNGKFVFDRFGYLYHGRAKAFAEKLRVNGVIN